MTVDQTSSDDRTFDAAGILAAAVAMQPLVRENAE
jgi:hypothetical protein